MVKQRRNGRVVGAKLRVNNGDEAETLALLGISTAYAERNHLTMRLSNGRLVRRTLGFSKEAEMYKASVVWEDLVYNLARPHKTLRVEVANDPPLATANTPHGCQSDRSRLDW